MAQPNIPTWSASEIGRALEALARASGYPTRAADIPPTPADLLTDQHTTRERWLQAVAARLGLELEPVYALYQSSTLLLQQAGPAIIQLPAAAPTAEPRLLVLLASTHPHRLTVLASDLTRHRVPLTAVNQMLCAPYETPLRSEIEHMLDTINVPAHRRARAAATLMRERLGTTEVGHGWLLRLPPEAPIGRQLVSTGVIGMVAGLVGAHALQYGLLLLAWGMLGSGVLADNLDTGLLIAWVLLLLTMLPFRLLATWLQGVLAIEGGTLLKQKLLAGCLRLAPEALRTQGMGQILGRVLEAERIETLAISGGLLSLTALIELAFAAAILASGAGGPLHALLLMGWLGVTLVLGGSYLRRHQHWTNTRLNLSHDLIERMVGHRTRLAQEAATEWHREEDTALKHYLRQAQAQDQHEGVLLAAVPRGWLIVGLLGLAPAFVAGTDPTGALALALGGVVLAYLALLVFVQGLWSLVGAWIAWRQVAPLVAACQQIEPLPAPAALAVSSATDATQAPLIDADNLVFRYRPHGRPVLRNSSLQIYPGDRLLLEGPSGGGKSTLAAVVAGLRVPESGLLLLNGLDRQTLGAVGWRQRVVTAPQFHENHVFTGTFAFNLLMGRRWPPDHSDIEEAEALCEELGLGPLLARMPGGMLQAVGDTGWQLSHGEKSRLFIARALLQGADLVVLDESFAALDPENLERALTCVLKRAPTLLVIAHP
ncbi:MAG: ABC transporter ATP-binding protein [Chloroflexaceae bacterium]|nr:ABC transporter ATP-binding protein [Chloroflexaceae bacterium]